MSVSFSSSWLFSSWSGYPPFLSYEDNGGVFGGHSQRSRARCLLCVHRRPLTARTRTLVSGETAPAGVGVSDFFPSLPAVVTDCNHPAPTPALYCIRYGRELGRFYQSRQ
jgi:hypothetical protein